MNIREISRKSGVSLSRLRTLEKMGVLKVDAENENVERIRVYTRRRTQIPLAMLLELLDDPDMIDDLGSVAEQAHAQAQIDALGDLSKWEPPLSVAAAVPDARKGVPVALRSLRQWFERVAPVSPVNFHWFAVRLIRAAPPVMRDQVLAGMNTAFAKLRGLDEFQPYWHHGTRGVIFYHQPVNFSEIKHDL